MLLNSFDPDTGRVPSAQDLADMDRVLDARYSFAFASRQQAPRSRPTPQRPADSVARSEPPPTEQDWAAIQDAVNRFEPDLIWLERPLDG